MHPRSTTKTLGSFATRCPLSRIIGQVKVDGGAAAWRFFFRADLTLGKVDFGGQSRLDFGQSRLSNQSRLCFSVQRQRRVFGLQTKDDFGRGEMNFVAEQPKI